MTTLDYARKKLFGPLGIRSTPAYTEVVAWGRIDIESPQMEAIDNAEFAWAVTEDGFSNGCCMLKLKPEDMVKIGRLYLDRGQWDGRPSGCNRPLHRVRLAATTGCSGG
jgi:CubicO group peptidase (beta-lactamase class C family)